MHWTKLSIVLAAIGVGMPVWGAEPARGVEVARSVPTLVRLTHLESGQTIGVEEGAARLGSARRGGEEGVRGAGVVFDTMTNTGSTTGLNVAYLDPASYTGGSSSTHAFAVSLAERLVYRAPMDPETGFPLPTDILWNDYACDASRWPGGAGGGAQAVASFGFIPYFQNSEPPLRERYHTVRVSFFSVDRRTEYGGFEATYRVSPGQTGYFGATIDLSALSPPVVVPPSGWIMVDWVEPGNSGVGCMFTGGDLQNPLYPRPETLWVRGSSDVQTWAFADGVTGTGGPPAAVDGAFDGDASSVSYLDIVNTGALANWQFTAGSPATMFMAHDFAWRLTLGEGAPGCPCDMDGSGTLNSQDFFEFLVGFFEGDGDFNGSGATNSQDFFDFLTCFFETC